MNPPVQRLLVARSPGGGADAAHVQPFARHAVAIRRTCGREVEVEKVEGPRQLLDWTRSASRDWLFVQARVLDGLSGGELEDYLDRLRPRVERLVWMDCHDSSMREQFRLAPKVDLMIRRSLVRHRATYGIRLLQGRVQAEAVRRRFRPGFSALRRALGLLAGERRAQVALSLLRIWHSALRPDPYVFAGSRFPEKHGAVVLGWNLGLGDRIADLASAPREDAPRPIDLVCRVRVASEGLPAWYRLDRLEAVRSARRLGRRWRVVASSFGLPRGSFFGEMRQARLAVSPFGWGEVCWRDFEAVLCGCLLVKPSMRHLETWPDVYLPHETYVPVRWDWSDLEAACRPYLEDEARRQAVAENARRILIESLGEQAFLERLGAVFSRLTTVGC